MNKSSKRIKLEKEIFSKSIKDIEQMFNLSYDDDDEEKKRKVLSRNSSPSNNSNNSAQFNRLDLPAGTGLQKTSFHYDCVNLSFMLSDTGSEYEECKLKVPVLPSSSFIPGQLPPLVTALPRTVLLDLNDDDDVDDYKFELDLNSYLPRLNLEKDLNMIDQMFMRPLHLR